MVASADRVSEGFPHPNLRPINGIPTYASIAEINLWLNANAASVQSNLGDGLLGLLYLTVSQAKYNTLSAVPFIVPVNPGAIPVLAQGMTAAQLTALMRQHTTDTAIFREYNATDKALKQQLLGAVGTIYLWTLAN